MSSLVADGDTVMMERVDRFQIDGKPFEMPMMAAVELDVHGRITRYRESFDLKSITDQIAAARLNAY